MLRQRYGSPYLSRGTSGIEFIILFAAIIGLFIAFLGPSGLFQNTYNEVLSSTSEDMDQMAARMSSSWEVEESTNAVLIAGLAEGESAGGSGSGTGTRGSSGTGGGGGSGSSGGAGGGFVGGGGGGGSGSGGGVSFGGTVTSGGGSGSSGTHGNTDSGDAVVSAGGSTTVPEPPVFGSEISEVLSRLAGTVNGQYYYDLIQAKDISVVYADFDQYSDVSSSNVAAFWDIIGSDEEGREGNTIYMNQLLKEFWVESAIASVLVHEATHADYTYNPEKAIAETLARHTELTRDDLNIYREDGEEVIFGIYDPETDMIQERVYLLNSIDQEYVSFANALEYWQEIKGSDTNASMEQDMVLYLQGEAVLKSSLRQRYGSGLPEY